MKKVLAGAVVALALVLIYRSYTDQQEEEGGLQEGSVLIQEQLRQVSKLVVTEGHFAEIYNYRDSKELFGPLITANKKALVVVNAKAMVTYDLSKLEYELDTENKRLYLKALPEHEIAIHPDLEYYDVSADYFNPFDADDHNAIKRKIETSLMKKVEASTLRSNAQNRLLSELSKLLVVTHSMGWTLVYNGKGIDTESAFGLTD